MTPDPSSAGRDPVWDTNPFPGLRPFESHESPLFFGRDEQCDELLSRLGRRRLVAVVGLSGSGKSSLVRAGLLPALERGYLPSAGSSWHIVVFRPGSDPVANLTRGLVSRRLPGGGAAEDDPDEIRALLDASSLGLATVARRLLHDRHDSLLIVADQFEELFRFSRIANSESAEARAAACVDLLLNAATEREVPVYVVLTMRSDYLGDCAHFTGLPEALNDSQFLVPRMTRAQLRAAIESPVAVGGARIAPRLVQRLLHELEEFPSSDDSRAARQDQDQLPVLQHALMRMWEVSRPARERGEPIDVPHYEQPPVETLRHALDRHAEEVYRDLPTDVHRDVARVLFQQLTDRDAENREVRRPTPLAELIAVARDAASTTATAVDASVVTDVIAAFSAAGRAFVVVNAQQDVDISHESFIRQWSRLREWVERESRSRRLYAKLGDAAEAWNRREGSLYRGPELTEAHSWWERESPTSSWASRYDSRFELARRFLARSRQGRRLRRGLLIGNVAVLLIGATAIAVLMTAQREQARRAEAQAVQLKNEALGVRNESDVTIRRLSDANRFLEEALELERTGNKGQAEAKLQQAQQVQTVSSGATLTASELSELDRLRRQETVWRRTEADLRAQLDSRTVPVSSAAPESKAEVAPAERAELERLRIAESAWQRDRAQLSQQLAAANDRAVTLQDASAVRKSNEELPASVGARDSTQSGSASADRSAIERLLEDFQAAHANRDAEAVFNLMLPAARSTELAKSFSQVRAYELKILNPEISIVGDAAVVTCQRRISIEPRTGRRFDPVTIPSVIRLKKSAGAWKIESVAEKR